MRKLQILPERIKKLFFTSGTNIRGMKTMYLIAGLTIKVRQWGRRVSPSHDIRFQTGAAVEQGIGFQVPGFGPGVSVGQSAGNPYYAPFNHSLEESCGRSCVYGTRFWDFQRLQKKYNFRHIEVGIEYSVRSGRLEYEQAKCCVTLIDIVHRIEKHLGSTSCHKWFFRAVSSSTAHR